MGLLDAKYCCARIFGKTISQVLSLSYLGELHWSNSWRCIMCKSLQLYPSANKNTLNNFLSSPGAMKRLRGLNQTTALWLAAYQAIWTLEKSDLTGYSSGNHGTI